MVSKKRKSEEALQTTEERLRKAEKRLRAVEKNLRDITAEHAKNRAANKLSFEYQKSETKRLEKRLASVELGLVYREAIRTTNFDKLATDRKIAPGNKQVYLQRSTELCF